jgi:hypothetical protein
MGWGDLAKAAGGAFQGRSGAPELGNCLDFQVGDASFGPGTV